jgi:RHS repeat-associated protein
LNIDKTTGVLTWTPAAAGTVTFTVVATDTHNASGTHAVTLQVVSNLPPNHPPTIGNMPRTYAQAGTLYAYDYNASDPDGDPLTYFLDGTIPAGLTFAGGVISWTPTAAQLGVHSFTARVTDGRGGEADLPFTVTVGTGEIANRPPTITSTPPFTATATLEYAYNATATDPDGDPIRWSFDESPAGAVIDAATGKVRWVPTVDQVGTRFEFKLRASDPYAGAAIQTFSVDVFGLNRPPQITSDGPATATIGTPYFYAVRATDPDGDPVHFALLPATLQSGEHDPLADGAAIDPATGLVTWTPAALGTYRFRIQAADNRGGTTEQVYTVASQASPVNRPPAFDNFLIRPAVVGRSYTLPTKASDPDGDTPLTYQLTEFPNGMTIDGSGVIHWPSPTGTDAWVTAKVFDPAGLSGGVRFDLPVRASNAAPVIDPASGLTVSKGAEFAFDVHATDADNDPLTFTLSGLSGGTIDDQGRVRWDTATADLKGYSFTVTATDPVGDFASVTFLVTVTPDQTAPVVVIEPSPNPADVNTAVSVRVTATDDVGVASRDLQAYLNGAWKEVLLDAAGVGQFTPTISGSVQLKAAAKDAAGNEGDATGSVRVVTPNDNNPPVAAITGPPAGSPQGPTVTFTGTASDPENNLVSWELDVRLAGFGSWIPVGSGTDPVTNGPIGQLNLVGLTDGTYDVRLVAKDAVHTAEADSSFIVNAGQGWTVNPNDTVRPTVVIAAPADGATVAGTTNVVGTVDDPDNHLVAWKLEASADGATWSPVANGTSEVANAVLGVLDPTTLRNGAYTLRLTAFDQGGSSQTQTTVNIDSAHLKLGDFQLSFTDVTIPVAGIPITVGRKYDTLDAGKSGDFGYGWSLALGGYRVEVDMNTVGPNYDGYPAFVNDQTRVYVVHEDGTRDGYTFYGKPGEDLFGIPLDWEPAFAPDPGVINKLNVDPVELADAGDGTYLSYDGYVYSPFDPVFGGAFDVKEPTGITYSVDANTGNLVSANNRNGTELEVADDGITSNRGRSVGFTRDYRGRITAVTDPRGNSVKYGYDPTTQDLVAVYDRTGARQAGYTYRPDVPHYLATVTDAFGTTAVQASYDPTSKRLSGLADASGKSATFGYTVAAPSDPNPERAVQTTTVDDGNPATNDTTTTALNGRGDLIRAVDQNGQQALATYSDPAVPDVPTRNVQVLGQPDSPQNGETDDLITDTKYDPNTGLPVSTSNPYRVTDSAASKGATTTIYNNQGLPQSVSDPLGDTTSNTYDDNGNLTLSRSPDGVTSSFQYDSKGNMTGMTQAGSTATMAYDALGQVTQTTDPQGNVSRYFYDDNGNRYRTERDWYADPVGKTGKVTVVTKADFDANDRPYNTYDELGNKTQTVYDRDGRTVETIDPLGNMARTVYDPRGLVVETDNPDGTVTRTAYDSNGRNAYATDPFVVGQANPVYGTHTVYDAAGRTVRVERLVGLSINVAVDGNGLGMATVANTGAVESASETAYDPAGRVDYTIRYAGTPHAAKNQFEYDSAGRQVAVDTYTAADFSTFTRIQLAYDKAGRQTLATDAAGVSTKTEYDDDGQVTRVDFADGTSVQTGYDAQGRKAFEVDAVGQRTDYGYDAHGFLVSELQPAVFDPVSGATKRPETAYGYDAYGNQTSITDASGRVTMFSYDEFGRQTKRTLPAVGGVLASETKAYDKYGNLDFAVDFNGQKQQYVYDYDVAGGTTLGRAVELDLYDQTAAKVETVGSTYDPFGRPATVTETKGSTVRVTSTVYDAKGEVTRVNSPEGVVNYAYDPVTGRQTKMWTDQTEVDYAYDVLGRDSTVSEVERAGTTLASPVVTGYTYDPVGNVSAVTVNQGATALRQTTNTYDPNRHWLVGVQNKDGAGSVLSSFTYTRRGDGQITTASEAVTQPGGGTETTTTTYAYDGLDRLTREAADTSTPGGDYTNQYTLDLVGNRTQLVQTKEGQSPVTTVSTYDARDRLQTETTGGVTITYSYDADGNLIMQQGGGQSVTYTWDVRGRMTGATVNGTTTGYTYTPGGIQSSATTAGQTTLYVIDALSPSGYAQVVEERTASGLIVASYVYGAGLAPLGQWRQGPGAGLYLADGQGSVRQLFDPATGAVLLSQRFDAYGNTVAKSGTAANTIGFRGQRFDPAIGQYYMRARYYNPLSGRFTSMDPFAGNYTDALQVMRYGYAGMNPVANADPNGMFFGATLGCFFGFSLRVGHLVVLGAVLLAVLGALWYFGVGRGTIDNANARFQTDGPRVAAATITIETAAGQGDIFVNGQRQSRPVSLRAQTEVRRIIDDSLSRNVPGFRRGSVTINFIPAPGPDPMARVQNEALFGRTAPGVWRLGFNDDWLASIASTRTFFGDSGRTTFKLSAQAIASSAENNGLDYDRLIAITIAHEMSLHIIGGIDGHFTSSGDVDSASTDPDIAGANSNPLLGARASDRLARGLNLVR